MIGFLGALFIIGLFVIIAIAIFVLNILQRFFGFFSGNLSKKNTGEETKIHKTQTNKNKIIEKSEGEYVDFEEII
jgi:beta-lactamase regulating signal transducer with metallopeptidase domain